MYICIQIILIFLKLNKKNKTKLKPVKRKTATRELVITAACNFYFHAATDNIHRKKYLKHYI